MKEASTCDIMVIAGTSLAVSPANTLPIYAKQNGGATLIEVNPEKTVMSNDMDSFNTGYFCGGITKNAFYF